MTRTRYGNELVKLSSEGKVKVITVPFDLKDLTPVEWAKLRDVPSEERYEWRSEHTGAKDDFILYGSISLQFEGHWCQVTIIKESVELKISYLDWVHGYYRRHQIP